MVRICRNKRSFLQVGAKCVPFPPQVIYQGPNVHLQQCCFAPATSCLVSIKAAACDFSSVTTEACLLRATLFPYPRSFFYAEGPLASPSDTLQVGLATV